MTEELPSRSDLHDFLFFLGERVVDQLDVLVGQLLHLVGALAVLVLGNLVVLLELLERLHAVAADVTHGDAPLLGVFVGDLAEFGTTLLVLAGVGGLFTYLLTVGAGAAGSVVRERQRQTIESLLTIPVPRSMLLWAKWRVNIARGWWWGVPAVIILPLGMLASDSPLTALPTVLYVVILRKTGNVDWHVVGSSYLGLFLVGAQYLAIGILASALTKSQFVALLVTVLIQFGLFVLGIGEYIFDPGLLHDLCAYVSLSGHMEDFSKGIVDSRRLLYDASSAIFCLFLTVRSVDSWRRA